MNQINKKYQVDAVKSLVRAAFAAFTAAANGTAKMGSSADTVAKKLYPADDTAQLIARAAVTGATTTDSAWAGLLAAQAAGKFYSTLPNSAASRLIAAGAMLSIDGRGTIKLPIRSVTVTGIPWVGEGAPIPVRQIGTSNATLGPAKKLASILVLSREITKRSGAESVFAQLLREEAALALDAALFNGNAATADAPAGLLNGVTPIAAASAGSDALDTDLAALLAEIAEFSESFAVIAAPRQAVAIAVRRPDLTFPVWPSAALPQGTVIAIDPTAFASGFGTMPGIDASAETTLHMEDTTPDDIGTVGSPNVVSAPVQSMFQTGQIATRIISDAAFTMRAEAVSVVEGVSW